MTTLFSTLSSASIAEFIYGARNAVCYAGPGIHCAPARAIVHAGQRLGVEMVTVSLDFDEGVFRMGFGDIAAVSALHDAGVLIHHSPGLRTAVVIVDDVGFIFTPTPHYLEAEPSGREAPNALRLSRDQLAEALARLSPAAKAIAMARAKNLEEKSRLSNIPVEMASNRVTDLQFQEVERRLLQVPPVRFDLARQVRIFEPYLQYVELSLSGAAIQRHRVAIPLEIQRLGGSQELENRLRTTFDLIEKGGKLSSKPLEDELNKIRRDLTRPLGKNQGRVMLKSAKPRLNQRLEEFRKKLKSHQETVEAELQNRLNTSRDEIIAYYLPRVIESPPDALLGQLLTGKLSKEDAQNWLQRILDRNFPTAEKLTGAMQLDVHFKDVTFETLNHQEFLGSMKRAYPDLEWDKAYAEFKAAGESCKEGRPI